MSCGKITPNGKVETKDVSLKDFHTLNLKGKFRVFYVKNPKNFVSIETYPNVFSNLKVESENNTLTIEEKSETKGVDVYNITIYSKNFIQDIKQSDSVELELSTQTSVDNFKLNLRNHSKFMGSVLSNKAEITMADKTRANILGKTLEAKLSIKDTASIIAPYWYVNKLNLSSQNGNYAEVNVSEELSGNISNTSKFIYYEDPVKKLKVTDKAKIEQKKLP